MRICSVGMLLFLLLSSCISKYEFDVEQESEYLVVDGFISDISYNDIAHQQKENLLLGPRYFQIKLKTTSTATNTRDRIVSGAEVTLHSSSNQNWDYVEIEEGTYILPFEDFAVELGGSYKLSIVLANGEKYESTFEVTPEQSIRGELISEQSEKREYEILLDEEIISIKKGVLIKVKMPAISTSTDVYNRWDFETTFVVIARNLPTATDPNYRCWVTSDLFYDGFVLAEKGKYGGAHEMLFFDTDQQEIYDGFSIKIRQQSMTKGYYKYWDGIEKQQQQSDLFAPPPFNISSNIMSVGHDKKAYGYFGVVREQYYRWVFSSDMIDYEIVFFDACNIPLSEPSPQCFNCLNYDLLTRMTITNNQPFWW